ncbi:MAG: hypothetical protein IKR19_08260 [Acholeplasmatales bacterium]|nr:hypothetical protein [Acholeplasmatales bacterium]
MSIFENYLNEEENEVKSGDVIFEDGEAIIANEIELFDSTVLSEDTLFANNSRYKYSLYIDPDMTHKEGFLRDPYVKIYDGQSFSAGTNCIRVHLKDGKCEHHYDRKGGLPFNDSGWKEFLDAVINKPSTNKNYKNYTVFEAAFKVMQYVYNMTDDQMEPYKFQPLPSYKAACYWGGKNARNER